MLLLSILIASLIAVVSVRVIADASDDNNGECSTISELRGILKQNRSAPFVCLNINSSFFSDPPWEQWSFDNPEAYRKCNFKVMKPLPREKAVDNIWTTEKIKFIDATHVPSTKSKTARHRVKKYVKPGNAIAIEQIHRVDPVKGWHHQLVLEQGIVAVTVDIYATHTQDDLPSGSYGWHMDSVDALIYVVKGRKHIRVAGYYPGSPIVIDQMLTAGSAVYVPGGLFHHVLSYSSTTEEEKDQSDNSSSSSSWTMALSIALLNANEDLLKVRMQQMSQFYRDKGMKWPSVVVENNNDNNNNNPPPEFISKDLNLPSQPIINFASKDSIDANGFNSLHRCILEGNVNRMYSLQFGNNLPNLEFRTTTSGNGNSNKNRTALGLALCCSPQSNMVEVVNTLLEFNAQTDAVEIDTKTGEKLSAEQVLLRRNGEKAWWKQQQKKKASNNNYNSHNEL